MSLNLVRSFMLSYNSFFKGWSSKFFLSSDINWASSSEWISQREFTEFVTWLNMQQTFARSYFLNFLRNSKANVRPFKVCLAASCFLSLLSPKSAALFLDGHFLINLRYRKREHQRIQWELPLMSSLCLSPIVLY